MSDFHDLVKCWAGFNDRPLHDVPIQTHQQPSTHTKAGRMVARRQICISVFVLLTTVLPGAEASSFKCKQADGSVAYQDHECSAGTDASNALGAVKAPQRENHASHGPFFEGNAFRRGAASQPSLSFRTEGVGMATMNTSTGTQALPGAVSGSRVSPLQGRQQSASATDFKAPSPK